MQNSKCKMQNYSVSKALNYVSGYLTLLTGKDNTEAEEQSNNDNLKHGCVCKRSNCVGGEDIDDSVNKAGCLCCGVAQLTFAENIARANLSAARCWTIWHTRTSTVTVL